MQRPVRARTAAAGVSLQCSAAGLEGGFVALRVTDTGMGIAPDVLPQVFEPFCQRARRHGPRPRPGLRLCAAVRRCCRKRRRQRHERDPLFATGRYGVRPAACRDGTADRCKCGAVEDQRPSCRFRRVRRGLICRYAIGGANGLRKATTA
ncbi:ATP-binding protein [Mesorhizobium sp. WSM3860]|uniref:ATP-binding protein n=1 Tax=Mesorhizobium sp. WSM3860 TaxID=2029403 RepID=UPI0032AEB457